MPICVPVLLPEEQEVIIPVSQLTISHINICSLRNKVHHIHHLLHHHKIHVLSVNETHLNSSIPDSSVHIPGYDLYRKDRDLHGGGVCIYVHSDIHSNRIPITELGVECVSVRLRLCTKPKAIELAVCSIYRPPSATVDFWNLCSQHLDVISRKFSRIIVLGDFNTDVLQQSSNNHHYKHLSNLCEEFHLRNVVTSPTRLAKTCLDLILV